MTYTETNPKVRVAEALLKHAKMLRVGRSSEEAIEAANWEIFFQNKLSELEAEAAKSTPALPDHHDPDAPVHRTGTLG